jgi:hypothetical protein
VPVARKRVAFSRFQFLDRQFFDSLFALLEFFLGSPAAILVAKVLILRSIALAKPLRLAL